MRTAVLALIAALMLAGTVAPAGHAAISPLRTIEGPGPGIVDLDGVAMAEDGSGGVVYRKQVDGRAHVFASQSVNGAWLPPQRIDVGQQFDSSWPRIAAAPGGQLLVVWVQEAGPDSDRLFSAVLDPGARRFGAPVPIDLDIGESTATFPSLAMNRGGAAYVVYRVINSTGGVNAPPGYVDADVRIARFTGTYWSVLGSVADRNQAIPVAAPTEANSPKVGIDVTGNGIVAWQEPDDDFVDRIWARRIFGLTLGIPLIVSPQAYGGAPLHGPADAFTLDETGFGEAAVALRQEPAPGSPLQGPHVFINTIPEAFSNNANQFGGARVADGAEGRSLPGTPGLPSVGVTPDGVFFVAYSVGGAAWVVTGGDTSVDPATTLGDGRGAVDATPAVSLGDNEAAALGWRARTSVVAVQERPHEGKAVLRGFSAPAGGPVGRLASAGSGLGDAVFAFEQGEPGALSIDAVTVDAPPLDFAVQTPIPFVRSKKPLITWDPATNALSPVRYRVEVDDRTVARGVGGRSLRLRAKLRDGRHEVTVLATDAKGQTTTSTPSTLKLDRRAPRVRLRVKGRRVTVRVVDGRKGRVAGVSAKKTAIKFGDGKRARGKTSATHLYKRGGRFHVVVKTADRAKNKVTVKRRVSVR